MKQQGFRYIAVTVMQINKVGIVVKLDHDGSLRRIPNVVIIDGIDHVDVGSCDVIKVAAWFVKKNL